MPFVGFSLKSDNTSLSLKSIKNSPILLKSAFFRKGGRGGGGGVWSLSDPKIFNIFYGLKPYAAGDILGF